MFYKYKSLSDVESEKWAFDSIENKYFYFSKPSLLNDRKDCRIKLDYSVDKNDVSRWVQDNREMYNYFFHDFNLSDSQIVDKIIKMHSSPKTRKQIKEICEKSCDFFRVLSMTKEWDNKHLWQNYAGKYNGICIGYECTKVNEKSIGIKITPNTVLENIYAGKIPNDYIFMIKMEYDNKLDRYYNLFKQNKEVVEYYLLHKTEKWSKEKEYRCVLSFDMTKDNITSDTKIYYPDTSLKEINFGMCVSDDKIQEIVNLIKSNYSTDVVFYKIEKFEKELSRTRI